MTEQPAEHWSPRCVVCASRGRTRELEHGHVCRACQVGLTADLGALDEAAALASVLPDPYATRGTTGGARPKPGSRPPLNVAFLDPAFVLVPLGVHDNVDPDDRYSADPLLVLLESWERKVREDRGLVAYGVATEGRRVTLAGVVAFLRAHVEWMCQTPEFPVEELARQVGRALGALRAMDPDTEHETRWTIPCPADVAAVS